MKIFTKALTLSVIIAMLSLTGCMSARQHYEQTHGFGEQQMTVGTVQKEIKKGMSAGEVAEVLGSPNIVTTDSASREVWIYDKISTDVTYSKDTGSLLVALFAGGPLGGGGGGALGMGDYNRSAGAKSTTQRTLTVVIKFDNENKVRDFAYHATKF